MLKRSCHSGLQSFFHYALIASKKETRHFFNIRFESDPKSPTRLATLVALFFGRIRTRLEVDHFPSFPVDV